MRSILLLCWVFALIGAGETCDSSKIGQCLMTLRSAAGPDALMPSAIIEQCSQYDTVMRCLDPYTDGCGKEELLPAQMTRAVMGYQCRSDILDGVRNAQDCLTASAYRKVMATCDFSKLGSSCEKAEEMTRCTSTQLRAICPQKVDLLYHNLMAHLLTVKKAEEMTRCTSTQLRAICPQKVDLLYHNLMAHLLTVKNKFLGTAQCSDIAVIESHVSGVSAPYHADRYQHEKDMTRKAHHTGLSAATIVGCIFGAIFVIGIVLAGVVIVLRQRHRNTRELLINSDVIGKF